MAGGRLDKHWWGGNLEGVRRHPVRLQRANRLVYSPHEYGPGVFPQPWFGRPTPARRLERRWRDGWGFIAQQGIAPLLIGEFGGRKVDLGSDEGRWQRQFLDHLARTGISWTYWALNPDSGDTGGVLSDDWTTPDAAKLGLLQRTIRRQRIGYVKPAESAAPRPQSKSRPEGQNGLRAAVVVENRWKTGWSAISRSPATTERTLQGHDRLHAALRHPDHADLERQLLRERGSRARGPARVGARADDRDGLLRLGHRRGVGRPRRLSRRGGHAISAER